MSEDYSFMKSGFTNEINEQFDFEKQVTEYNYDVFQAAAEDMREEGILDDICDLRRYLFLVEAEVRMRQNGKRKAR